MDYLAARNKRAHPRNLLDLPDKGKPGKIRQLFKRPSNRHKKELLGKKPMFPLYPEAYLLSIYAKGVQGKSFRFIRKNMQGYLKVLIPRVILHIPQLFKPVFRP
jgi:hypothetical protein